MKKKILIISIIALVITFIGSTYAFFMYSKTTKAFTLTSGDINIEFVNGDNNINLTYAYPISDNYAKDNLEKLGYIDFSINGKITEDKKVINYEIYLEEDSKNTLDPNYIKVYLTDDTNKEIVSPTIYNLLDKTSYANSDNGKVIYKTSKYGEFNDEYRIYVWIDSSYSQNTIQERFSFKVNLYAYNDNETAVSVIKSKLVKYAESSKETFTGGLVAVNTEGDLYNETDASQTIREYRYSGPNVNNYVTFNDETWRIIGVFKEENEEFLKIVRNNVLENSKIPETYIVNDSLYNFLKYANWVIFNDNELDANWSISPISHYLNNYNDDATISNYGYLHYLNENAINMIRESNFYLGNATFRYDNSESYGIIDSPKKSYINERDVEKCIDNTATIDNQPGCYIFSTSPAIWNGRIGLMYASDYGYSVNHMYWNASLFLGIFDGEIAQTSWLQKIRTTNEWLITRPVSTNMEAGAFYIDGYVGNGYIKDGAALRPTLYLKSNVKITSGDGSKDNAYKLSVE